MKQKKAAIGFYIGNMNRSGGTERVLAQISSELAARGWDVCILNMYGSETETAFYSFSPKIRRFWLLEHYPETPGEHMQEIRNLRRCLKREKLCVLVELDLILSIYALPASAGSGVPVIAWEHFNFYYQYRKHNVLHRLGMCLAAVSAQRLVVLTKEDERYYVRHFPWLKKRIRQIYNPNSYEVTEQPKDEERQMLVLAAGRLTPAKGFGHLLKSWGMLEEKFPEWHLAIAGDGELREKLMQQGKDLHLKHIHFLGNVPQEEMKTWYKKASVFAFPSVWEGFGMVLTEAMNYGLPCVSFACKAGPRDILENEQGGFLVKTGDEQAFSERLGRLMKSQKLRKIMGERAKDACRRFALSGIVDTWEELLTETYKKK